jgi:hypothetical protein
VVEVSAQPEIAPAGRDMTRRTHCGNLSQLVNPSPRGR